MARPASRNNLDVGSAPFGYEIRRRAPWMVLALAAGIAMVWIARNYEAALSNRIELVFFIPMIVYLSDSIGTETLALFVRALALEKIRLRRLIIKETLIGLSLGLMSGVLMGLISYVWMNKIDIAIVVATAMTINGVVAVLVGMLAPIVFHKLKRDPALGTDEITTAVSDNVSILVYLGVATAVLFGSPLGG